MQIDKLYDAYFKDVHRYLLKLTGNEALADDLTSDVFFKALSSVDRFRGDCEIKVWLLRIAKNCYYSSRRKSVRTESLEAAEALQLLAEGTDVSAAVINKMEAERAKRIIASLPEQYREVFTWRVFGELGFDEIGAMFGKTANWACVTYHRARKMIIKEME